MFVEMLEHLASRETLDLVFLIEHAAIATQTASPAHEGQRKVTVLFSAAPGIRRSYVIVHPVIALLNEALIKSVGNTMASSPMLIEVLQHRIASLCLTPISFAE